MAASDVRTVMQVIVSVELAGPGALGANVALSGHDPPGATAAEQAFDCVNEGLASATLVT